MYGNKSQGSFVFLIALLTTGSWFVQGVHIPMLKSPRQDVSLNDSHVGRTVVQPNTNKEVPVTNSFSLMIEALQSSSKQRYDDNYQKCRCNMTQNKIKNQTEVIASCERMGIEDFNELHCIWENTTILNLQNNNFQEITNSSFAPLNLPYLRVLNLDSNSKLSHITADAFKPLVNLQKLYLKDLPGNITWKQTALRGLHKLRILSLDNWQTHDERKLSLRFLCTLNHSRIKVLGLSNVNAVGRLYVFWTVQPPLFKCLYNTRVQKLTLANNQIIALREGVLSNFRHLVYLDLSHNIMLGLDIKHVYPEILNMHKLRIINVEYQTTDLFPDLTKRMSLLKRMENSGFSRNGMEITINITLPENLEIIKAKALHIHPHPKHIPPINLNGRNKVTYLDMSMIDFSNNTRFLDPISKLKNMKHLKLSKCQLNDFTFKIASLSQLELLDLSHNEISSVPDYVIKDWHHFNKSNTTIDLTGNPLQCPCSDLGKIGQLQRLKLHLKGFLCETSSWGSKKVDINKLNIEKAKAQCANGWDQEFVVKAFLGYFLANLGFLIASLGYRYRWRFAYLWYLAGAVAQFHRCSNQDADYLFDAFLCYNSKDYWFVKRLLKHMEKDLHYRFCVHERNFGAGVLIDENISDAFRCSKSSVMVISRNALKGRYFKTELHFAKEQEHRRGAKVICILLHDPDSFEGMCKSPTLRYLLGCSTYLVWPKSAKKESLFWLRLRNALGEPMGPIKPKERRVRLQTNLYFHDSSSVITAERTTEVFSCSNPDNQESTDTWS